MKDCQLCGHYIRCHVVNSIWKNHPDDKEEREKQFREIASKCGGFHREEGFDGRKLEHA